MKGPKRQRSTVGLLSYGFILGLLQSLNGHLNLLTSYITTSHPPRIDAVSLKSEKAACTVQCTLQQ
jgi:hypothetical protein